MTTSTWLTGRMAGPEQQICEEEMKKLSGGGLEVGESCGCIMYNEDGDNHPFLDAS